MKLLYVKWGYTHDDEIIEAFNHFGIETECINGDVENNDGLITNNTLDDDIDIVFSVNFYSSISNSCQELEMPYCSWTLQYPCDGLYSKAVINSCNFIGIGDSYLVEKLLALGVKKVFYLPDAVTYREQKEDILEDESEQKHVQVVLERGVASFSNYDELNFDDSNITKFDSGYINGFCHFQRECKGSYVLEEGIMQQVFDRIKVQTAIPDFVIPKMEKLYFADRSLAPIVDVKDSKITYDAIREYLELYTDKEHYKEWNIECNPLESLSKEDIDTIYATKEFVLVLPPRASHYAIDRNVLEIIMKGGVPIVPMNKDYNIFFTNEENILTYHDSDFLLYLLNKFGNDREKYLNLREKMRETVRTYHTYNQRIPAMLNAWAELTE